MATRREEPASANAVEEGSSLGPTEEPSSTRAAVKGPRDRYFDSLRAVALVRVIVYHMLGGWFLSFVFPAMGVMFAMAGSLMAHSLNRQSAEKVVPNRIRRLLPALWLLGLFAVPAMLAHGWEDRPDWQYLLLWLVPIADPPGSAWGLPVTIVLWYLVTYLWLVLLSPVLLPMYKRWPIRTMLLPLGVLGVLHLLPGLFGERTTEVVTNLAVFGACWVAGFAHREGRLRALAWWKTIALAVLLAGAGVAWAVTHRTGEGLDLNEIPIAQALYSLGFVLVLLKVEPKVAWLAKVPVLDKLVTGLNARAVTVYLWHNIAISLAFVVGDLLGVPVLGDTLGRFGYLVVAVGLLSVAVLAFGWVEDVAGRRRPHLVPWAQDRPTPSPAAAPPSPRQPAPPPG